MLLGHHWTWFQLWLSLAYSYRIPLPDPCAEIGGKTWVSPREARACMSSFPLEPIIKQNVIEVVNKTLAFHTSVNYQVQAPPPYETDVHVDLHAELARISQQDYPSEFAFHLDMYRTFKRVNDGHCGVYNHCYDSLYVTYLPLPLVLLTAEDGSQDVYVAPEAFKVASDEFEDEIEFWQDALPDYLQGKLESLSSAKVFLINGEPPFVAVNKNSEITGGYQSFATRQNSFFASYRRGVDGWDYSMGNFALHAHPLVDSVELTIQRKGSSTNDTFTLPYRSRFGSAAKSFDDSSSYRERNCVATQKTNGVDMYDISNKEFDHYSTPIAHFQQQPSVDPEDSRKHPINVMLDTLPLTDIDLPEYLQPKLPALEESYSVAQFFMLNDNRTGVLALGSFSAKSFSAFGQSLLDGLQELKARGAKNLIVDVTNNGGGYICIAHWLHRIIIGPKATTEPQAGLDTKTRAGPLAQLIVKSIVAGGDPDEVLSYNPILWTNGTHEPFPETYDWLDPPVKEVINGRKDAFSQRIGQECQPFAWDPPSHGLFKAKNVIIVSNGRCASSCSLFSITMSKLEGVKTIVTGGSNAIAQEYCGTVGGQSTSFSMVDTELKTAKLKNHTLAPPDFLTNSVQGITWRLGFGIDDPESPEEWQQHRADYNFPLTLETVNNPVAIWEALALQEFKEHEQLFRVQTS